MTSSKIIKKAVDLTHSLGVKFFLLLVVLLMLSFGIVTYVNIYFFTDLYREDIVSNAVQVSNLIKRATYHSMLNNRREDLTKTILSLGNEEIFEGIRIYNKMGEITFSDGWKNGVTWLIKMRNSVMCVMRKSRQRESCPPKTGPGS